MTDALGGFHVEVGGAGTSVSGVAARDELQLVVRQRIVGGATWVGLWSSEG